MLRGVSSCVCLGSFATWCWGKGHCADSQLWVSPKQVVQCLVAREVESRSVTCVDKGVNFGGGEVFLWVSTANLGSVCVWGGACQVGFGTWVASQMPNQLDR